MEMCCAYCFTKFEEGCDDWGYFENDNDNSSCLMCSICATEVLKNQEIPVE